MDWSNENYVRLYTRETDDELVLSWDARCVWRAMLMKFDRSGLIALKRGRLGLAALIRAPLEVVERAIPELLADGRVRELDAGYFAPNFMEAQEATKSDRQRQKESRERRRATHAGVTNRDKPSGVTNRDASIDGITERAAPVTNRDDSPAPVTNRDANVTPPPEVVTLTSADPDPKPVPVSDAREVTQASRIRERHPQAGAIARRAWDHATKLRGELAIAKIPTPPWPAMVDANHPGWQALLDRACELLVHRTPEEAEQIARNRVDVAAAKARADGDGQYFTPTAMFSRSSFESFAYLTPEQVARKGARTSPAEPREIRVVRDDDEHSPPPVHPAFKRKA